MRGNNEGWRLSLTFGDVEVEEVQIEKGLHTACNDGNDVIEAFVVVPPHPVNNVECSVGAQSKEVVGGDGLRLAGL